MPAIAARAARNKIRIDAIAVLARCGPKGPVRGRRRSLDAGVPSCPWTQNVCRFLVEIFQKLKPLCIIIQLFRVRMASACTRKDCIMASKLDRWKQFVSAEEIDAYRKGDFASRIGLGKRPALLNIDTTFM